MTAGSLLLIEPVWSRVRDLLQAEIGYRAQRLTEGGLDWLFAGLCDAGLVSGTATRSADAARHWDQRSLIAGEAGLTPIATWQRLTSGGKVPIEGYMVRVLPSTGFVRLRLFVQRDVMRSLRLLFLISLLICATGLTVQTYHSGGGAAVTVLCAAVQLFGFSLRIAEFRRARPLPVWVDVLELGAVLLLLSQVNAIQPVISTFFMAVLFRAAIGGLPRLLLSQAGYLGIWVIAIVMPWHIEAVAGAMLSLPTTSLMVYGTRTLMAKLQEQHQARNALLGSVLTELPFPVVVTDAAGDVALANPAVLNLIGWSADDKPGLRELRLADLEGRPVDLHEMAAASAAGATRAEREVQLIRADGSSLRIVVQSVPMSESLAEGGGVVLALLDVTAQRSYEEHLHNAAYFDLLTGLPNRRLLFERLGLAHSSGISYAMLLLDLNDFKSVNDTRGHKVGDELLAGVAQRLSTAVDETATVARLGGDEFAVLLPHAGAAEAETVAQAVRACFTEPLQLSCGPVQSGGTVGVALAAPGQTPDRVIERADYAMYLAKPEHKRRFRTAQSPRTAITAPHPPR